MKTIFREEKARAKRPDSSSNTSSSSGLGYMHTLGAALSSVAHRVKVDILAIEYREGSPVIVYRTRESDQSATATEIKQLTGLVMATLLKSDADIGETTLIGLPPEGAQGNCGRWVVKRSWAEAYDAGELSGQEIANRLEDAFELINPGGGR